MVSDFGATHPYPFQMLGPPPPRAFNQYRIPRTPKASSGPFSLCRGFDPCRPIRVWGNPHHEIEGPILLKRVLYTDYWKWPRKDVSRQSDSQFSRKSRGRLCDVSGSRGDVFATSLSVSLVSRGLGDISPVVDKISLCDRRRRNWWRCGGDVSETCWRLEK